ncbi:MAG: oligosaccharide flippase family protein [Flavobacterium sp.]|nr:oligosaccharide flippase family protein [Flavobacterium sp.]
MQDSSRTFNSVKNISFGLISQVIQMVLGFITRTIFIKYLAVEYLGVNSLFTNIISMLSLAELGIGSAIIYSLYKPLAEKNEYEIAIILQFYKKVYVSIGSFIFFTGLLLIPFLDSIIPHKPASITEDIRLLYFIFLFNTASSYFFMYKGSLLEADQQSSITTKNTTAFLIIQNIVQIAILVLTKNFIFYLLVQLVCSLLSNYWLTRIVDKRYHFLSKHKKEKVNSSLKKLIISNTKATFYTKIGGALVNGTDNLIINYFVGLTILGKFSNYVMLTAIATNFLVIVFANVKSSIANVIVKEDKKSQGIIYDVINFSSFWFYGLGAVLMVVIMNDFITIWIGKSYILSLNVSIMIAVNFFMLGMQNAFWTFKSAYGFFEQGKYLVLLTAAINLLLSFCFGYYYGIFGVLLATAIARLVTNFWYDPYIVLKLGLQVNPKFYLFKFIKYSVLLLVSTAIIFFISQYLNFSLILNFIIKIILCLVITNGLIFLTYKNTNEFLKIKQLFSNAILVFTKKIT